MVKWGKKAEKKYVGLWTTCPSTREAALGPLSPRGQKAVAAAREVSPRQGVSTPPGMASSSGSPQVPAEAPLGQQDLDAKCCCRRWVGRQGSGPWPR